MVKSIKTKRFSPRGVSFLGLFCVLFLSSLFYAQRINAAGATSSPACKSADFDTRAQFFNGPSYYYTIAFNFRNISGHSCVLNSSSIHGPSFIPDQIPGGRHFRHCFDCANLLSDGSHAPTPPITLQPDQFAHQSFRWKTARLDGTAQCLQPKAMVGPFLVTEPLFLVTEPLFLKKVCSDIDVSRYDPGTFLPEDQDRVDDDKLFELSAEERVYYERESFFLHVSPLSKTRLTTSNAGNCPKLYLLQRSPDGMTRLDAMVPAAFKGCRNATMGVEAGDWQSGFTLGERLETEHGEHTFEVFQEIGSPGDDRIRFVHSNILHVQIMDPLTVPRKWGPKAKGLAVDVTLDKDTIRLGEDVPLHIALENFDAVVPIYGPQPIWDPCSVVAIKVQDATGKSLSEDERFAKTSACEGHGLMLPYPEGKIFPLETTLKSEGWLPIQAGTYTVVVTWCPAHGSNGKSDPMPYAIARSAVTIRIVGRDK